MADRYLDITYVRAHVGTDYLTALTGVTGFSLDVVIESGTGVVQGYLRNSGYTPPATQDPADVPEEVKAATMAAVWESLSSLPEKAVPLPDEWEEHALKAALVGIYTGRLNVDLPLNKIAAVGGSKWTSSTASPQRASRSELEGF